MQAAARKRNVDGGQFSAASIRSQLEKVIASDRFRHAQRLTRFLRFAVEQAIQGRGEELKEYSVALEVFDREESFDPRVDPIVRVQAGNLRARLKQYYEHEGRRDPIRIEFPKGSYVPVFGPPPAAAPMGASLARRSRYRATAAFVVLLAVATAIVRKLPREPAPELSLKRLTFHTRSSSFPVISRDGRRLAYSSDHERQGNFDIWVQPMAGGQPVRLTHHEANDRQPDFSPDGSQIAFRSERDGGGIYVVSVAGGQERKIAELGYNPRFSPDGNWIAYGGQDHRIHIVPATGGESRVPRPDLETLGGIPVWTPDGRRMIYTARPAQGPPQQPLDWWVVSLDNQPPVKTGASAALERQGLGPVTPFLVPSDWSGDSVVFFASVGEVTNLWQIPISPRTWKVSGPARQLTFGAGTDTTPRAVPGGGLVFVSENRMTHVWGFPIDANQGKVLGDPAKLTGDTSLRPGRLGTRPRLSQDGQKLIFSSRRSGNLDIWWMDLRGGREAAVTANPWPEDQPLISPDGSRIAYQSQEGERRAIYAGDLGGAVRKVCDDCGALMDWSRDGKRVLYGAGRPERVFVMNVETGQRFELIARPRSSQRHATFSPDGNWIAWVADDGDRLLVAAFQDGKAIDVRDRISIARNVEESSPQWSPDGNLLYFLSQRDGFRCVWAQRLHPATKKPAGDAFPVHHFHSLQRYPWMGSPISLAHDKLAVPLTEVSSSIWLAEWKRTSQTR